MNQRTINTIKGKVKSVKLLYSVQEETGKMSVFSEYFSVLSLVGFIDVFGFVFQLETTITLVSES